MIFLHINLSHLDFRFNVTSSAVLRGVLLEGFHLECLGGWNDLWTPNRTHILVHGLTLCSFACLRFWHFCQVVFITILHNSDKVLHLGHYMFDPFRFYSSKLHCDSSLWVAGSYYCPHRFKFGFCGNFESLVLESLEYKMSNSNVCFILIINWQYNQLAVPLSKLALMSEA